MISKSSPTSTPRRGALAPDELVVHGPHDTRGLRRWLMFPQPQRSETIAAQSLVAVCVTRTVAVDFGQPEIGAGLRRHEVLRAPVPEAPIYKHVQTGSTEYDVRTPPWVKRERVVDAEPQSGTVQ